MSKKKKLQKENAELKRQLGDRRISNKTQQLMEKFIQAHCAYAIQCAEKLPADINNLVILNDAGRIIFGYTAKVFNANAKTPILINQLEHLKHHHLKNPIQNNQ